MNTKLFGATVFGAVAIGFTAMPEVSQAATFTVNGTVYDVTTVSGSYNSLQSQLQKTPWWGNLGLASQFANTILGNLGFPNQSGIFAESPYFAYRFSPNPSLLPEVYSYGYSPSINGTVAIGIGVYAADTNTYALATVIPTQTIPTPALLPGLVGMGIATLRSKQEKKKGCC